MDDSTRPVKPRLRINSEDFMCNDVSSTNSPPSTTVIHFDELKTDYEIDLESNDKSATTKLLEEIASYATEDISTV